MRLRTPRARAALPILAAVAALGLMSDAPTIELASAAAVGLIVSAVLLWQAERRFVAWQSWLGGGRLPGFDPDGMSDLDRFGESVARVLALEREEKGWLVLARDSLEGILAGITEAVVVLDRQGRVLRSNPQVAEAFGLDIGENLIGQFLSDLSRDPGLREFLRAGLAGDELLQRELTMDAGTLRTLAVSLGPSSEGKAWVLVAHDISELRRLERVKTDFVANVSHELRTPLTAIKGFAETLVYGGMVEDGAALSQLRIIDRQAERLGRLIDDLLVLSDLELGRMPVRPSELRLLDLVLEVVEFLGQRAAQRGILIQTMVAAEVYLYADSDRLQQVLVNLLDNAIKFSTEGNSVVVQASPSGLDGWAFLRVTDRGRGIATSELPRLAERFYRVDRARSRELGGTGLGLSIVKHIVRAHGGRLEIESELGRGTRVTALLPTRAGLDPLTDLT